jgi:hypothetical protein
MAYEIWNGTSGSIMMERPTREEALAAVRSMIDRYGPDSAADLALIHEDADGSSHLIAEGAELAKLSQELPARI